MRIKKSPDFVIDYQTQKRCTAVYNTKIKLKNYKIYDWKVTMVKITLQRANDQSSDHVTQYVTRDVSLHLLNRSSVCSGIVLLHSKFKFCILSHLCIPGQMLHEVDLTI